MENEITSLTLEELQALVPGSTITSVEQFKETVTNLRSLVGDKDNESYRKLFATLGYDDMTKVDATVLNDRLEEAAKNNDFIKGMGIDISKHDPIKLAKIIQASEVKTVIPAKSKSQENNNNLDSAVKNVMKFNRERDQVALAREMFGNKQELVKEI